MSVCWRAVVLLLLCGAQRGRTQTTTEPQQNNFYGTVITQYPKDTYANGTMTVVLRYKNAFTSCSDSHTWECHSSECGNESHLEVNTVYNTSEWCQREGIMTRLVPINAYFLMLLYGANWINNNNDVVIYGAITHVNLRTRSDTGESNRSPQTTIIPSLRVPSNCGRNFTLLAFDPDGDRVKCYQTAILPSFLNLSPDCTLSFAATNSSNEGNYNVQLYMRDYPNQDITVTGTDGSQYTVTTSNGLSRIPLHFVIKVDGAVASCTEGQYLPRFLPPTPDNRAQLYSPVGHTLEITIISTVSELLFSGPHNMELTGPAQGQFILRWTPSQSEDGEHHPVCFVAQTNSTSTYQSELRCVIVSVSNEPTTTTPAATTPMGPPATRPMNPPATLTTTPPPPATTSSSTSAKPTMTVTSPPEEATVTISLPTADVSISYTPGSRGTRGLRVRISSKTRLTEEDIRTTVLPKLKEELVRRGLPADAILKLLSVQPK